MIRFEVRRAQDPRWGFTCLIDPRFFVLGQWLEMELGSGAGFEKELFEDIAKVRSGAKEKAISSGDAFAVTVRGDTVTIDPVARPALRPLTLPVDDFTDAVVRWYETVDPSLAAQLRAVQGAGRA